MAGPDGGVFGVGFVYVGEDGGKLGSVVGYLKDVELSLADEVGRIAWAAGICPGSSSLIGGVSQPPVEQRPVAVRVLRGASGRGVRRVGWTRLP